MATTTNFGWETPDDTDLVKDGAAAMRTLGNSIDTSFVDLKGGTTNQVLAKNSNTDLDFKWVADATGIPATIIDAKGDLIAGTAADTAGRLAVGANGTVLTADSGETTGLKWATPAGAKNFSLLNTGGTALTGATTVTYSGISGMDQLYILISAASSANASAYLRLQLNTDTGTNYIYQGIQLTGDNLYDAGNLAPNGSTGTTNVVLAQMGNTAASTMSGGIFINGCNTAGLKMIQTSVSGNANTSGHRAFIQVGAYTGTSTISSISLTSSTGNFDAGTFYVYGSA